MRSPRTISYARSPSPKRAQRAVRQGHVQLRLLSPLMPRSSSDFIAAAANSGVTSEPLICLGGEMWALFPWLGSYAFLALERFLKVKCTQKLRLSGLTPSRPYFMVFKMKVGKREFFEILREEAEQEFDPMDLVYPDEIPLFEKYDEYVPAELVRKGFANGILAVDEMKDRVRNWARSPLTFEGI